MKIKILGTRGEIKVSAPKHSNHSGILADGKIMFDVGEKKFLSLDPKYIFITHLHPDHAFFVRNWEKFDRPFYAPEKYELAGNGQVFNKKINIVSCKITSIPTIHSIKVKSQGYLIEKNQKRILYTGDLIWIDKKYHKLLKDLDLVITEASFYQTGGVVRKSRDGRIFGHTGVPNLTKLFSGFTKKIIFVHFGSWAYKNMRETRHAISELGKTYGVDAILGYDGLELNL